MDKKESANKLALHSSKNCDMLHAPLPSTLPNKINDERAKTIVKLSSRSFCDPDRYIPLKSSPKCTSIPLAREQQSMEAIDPPTIQQAHSTSQVPGSTDQVSYTCSKFKLPRAQLSDDQGTSNSGTSRAPPSSKGKICNQPLFSPRKQTLQYMYSMFGGHGDMQSRRLRGPHKSSPKKRHNNSYESNLDETNYDHDGTDCNVSTDSNQKDPNLPKRIQRNYNVLDDLVFSEFCRLHISSQEALSVDLRVNKTNRSTASWKAGEDKDCDVNGEYIPGCISEPSTIVFPPPSTRSRMMNSPRFATKQRVSKRTHDFSKHREEMTLTRTTTSVRRIAEKLLRKRKFQTTSTNARDDASVDNN